jgi:hypothetical protein
MVSNTPDEITFLTAESRFSAPISGSSVQVPTSVPRFELGSCFATASVSRWAEREEVDITDFLKRHHSGDWGDLCADDRQANENAIERGSRILSRYLLTDGKIIYTITEADRSMTTILFAAEY